jgi:hypothetical protein
MVTFMPTMAFANVQDQGTRTPATGVWATDGASVTVNGNQWIARRSLVQSSGMIKAQLDDSAYDSAALANVPYVDDVYYYDLTGATLYLADIYTQSGFEALFNSTAAGGKLNNPRFNIKTPDYVYDYANQPKTVQNVALAGWTVTVAFPEDYEANSEADKYYTLTAVIESDGANGSLANPYRADSTTITKQVKVLGQLPSVTAVKFYKDKVSTVAADATPSADGTFNIPDVAFPYDGDAHKVVSNSVTGYTVKYATLNEATGKYEGESDECPTVTNVGDRKKVKATITWTTTTTSGSTTTTTTNSKSDTFVLTVSAVGAQMPRFQFDGKGDVISKNNNTNNVPNINNLTTSYIYSIAEGEQYDATEWVDPVGLTSEPPVKAVVANEAALMDFFNDFYNIKKSTKAAYPDYEFLTIEKKADKEFDKDTFAALKTKHATLLKNFLGYTDAQLKNLTYDNFKNAVQTPVNSNGAVYFVKADPEPVVANDQDDDITFSGVTTQTFKAKKKTKKLAKTKSFQIKAVADSGNEITFSATTSNSKIKVSKTGKVTVKKGLKKGTYKVTVKAKTAAGNGYKAAKETKEYTVKIK